MFLLGQGCLQFETFIAILNTTLAHVHCLTKYNVYCTHGHNIKES